MDKVFQSPVDPSSPATPRFSLGRVAGGSLVACLWLWTSAGALNAALAVPAQESASSVYRQAQEVFARQDYDRALKLLERAPATASVADRADIVNLRGAIYLRQHRFDEAHQEFTRASQLDPGLWAARFNAAEVSFRQKQYAESRREFDALLNHTSRLTHSEERRFLQYKMALADLCGGQEKPALDFIAEHRSDEHPPAAWYYLNAAVEQRHDRPQKAEQWIAQADAKQAPATGGQMYAESFKRLGWSTDHADGTAVASSTRRGGSRRDSATQTTVAKAGEQRSLPKSEPEPAAEPPRTPAATMAVVQIMPASESGAVNKSPEPDEGSPSAPKSNFHSGMPPAPTDFSLFGNLPPSGDEIRANMADSFRSGRAAADTLPTTLRKPTTGRKASPSPTPSSSPSPSPGAASSPTDAAGALPADDEAKAKASPSAAPAASPSPEFSEKYEAALVKFIDKNLSAATDLLNEADKAQPNQPQAANLRTQIFKAYYGAAYLAFRKADYSAALEQLDGADRVQTVADSFNLRGLIQSKQRNYDQAEAMFKKAFTTDPTLWASRFNYAELPFNYGNYTMARSRFENLLDQTNKSNQPRETELTQYKVFLTLLMEGKVDAASNFRDHLNFTGATPARFFCQAALDFHDGNVEKAKGWIDSAKKDFPPQLVSIFIESFYRLGWMTDPSAAQTGTAIASTSSAVSPAGSPAETVAAASPAPTPGATGSATPLAAVALTTPVVAMTTPTVGPSAPAPTGTPITLAKASATPLPLGTPAIAAASPAPTVAPPPAPTVAAGGSPAVAFTPRPGPAATLPTVPPALASPSPALVKASATPLPAASPNVTALVSPTPAFAKASVTPLPVASPTASAAASPAPIFAKASPTPQPVASATVAAASPVPASPTPILVAKASPAPSLSVAATVPATPARTPVAIASATPTASPTPTPTPDEAAVAAKAKEDKTIFQLGVVGIVLLHFLYNMFRLQRAVARRKSRKRRLARQRSVAETAL